MVLCVPSGPAAHYLRWTSPCFISCSCWLAFLGRKHARPAGQGQFVHGTTWSSMPGLFQSGRTGWRKDSCSRRAASEHASDRTRSLSYKAWAGRTSCGRVFIGCQVWWFGRDCPYGLYDSANFRIFGGVCVSRRWPTACSRVAAKGALLCEHATAWRYEHFKFSKWGLADAWLGADDNCEQKCQARFATEISANSRTVT